MCVCATLLCYTLRFVPFSVAQTNAHSHFELCQLPVALAKGEGKTSNLEFKATYAQPGDVQK